MIKNENDKNEEKNKIFKKNNRYSLQVNSKKINFKDR